MSMGTYDQQRAIEVWADATAETTGNGTNRRWGAVGGCEMLYMLWCLATLIIALTLDLYGTALTTSDTILCCVVLVIHAAFSAYFIIHGIRAERPYELYCFIFSYLLICINLAVNAVAFPTRTEKVVTAYVVTFLVIPNIIISAIYINRYTRSRKLIIRTIVDRTDLEPCVVWVYRCKALIVMNLEIGLVCSIFAALHGNMHHSQDPKIVAAMVAVSILASAGFAALGFLFLMYEYSCALFWLVVFGAAQMGFVALSMFYACRSLQLGYTAMNSYDPFPIIALVDGCVAILVMFVLTIVFCVVSNNTGLGIHSLVFRPSVPERPPKETDVMFDPTKVEWYGAGPSQ